MTKVVSTGPFEHNAKVSAHGPGRNADACQARDIQKFDLRASCGWPLDPSHPKPQSPKPWSNCRARAGSSRYS